MRSTSLFAILTRSLLFYSLLVALLFIGGFAWVYQNQIKDQRAEAATRLGLLLQVSLENAMLKRDIPGLKDIIDRLGRQDGIASVMILNPQGEVRFASDPRLLDRSFSFASGALCPGCAWDGKSLLERSEILQSGPLSDMPVLRSVKAVANREACSQCHGNPQLTPFNGVLVVDYHAQDVQKKALTGALQLVGAGLLIVLGLLAGTYHALHRHVLAPVASLAEASRALAGGDLTRRVHGASQTELGDLGRTFNDMAERLARSISELAARERFVQALLDAMPDGIRVIDSDYRIVHANRTYREHVGSTSGSEVGRFCYQSSGNRTEPCVPTLVTCPLVALTDTNSVLKYQSHHTRPDGGVIHVEINAARVRLEGPDGNRFLVIEVIRDLDAEMRISHEQRLSEIGQLATGVAHEIRNPLSSVAMLLANTEANLRRGEAAEAEMAMRLIGHEIDRCLKITDSLLKLGTPPGSEPQLISLNEVVADIVSLLRYQAEDGHVVMSSDLTPDLRVLGSDSDLRIVLINLIQNAFHSMPQGGQLTLVGRRGARQTVSLSVSDTGVGIAEEHLNNIFLPFWSRRADGVNGTGLGLAICRSVISHLGGTITVTSTLGVGSTFTMTLPDPDASQEAQHGHAL
ncbi:MAG TPA: ATP-binding protein [Beijerinckiaceae bacterium]|nr:ATP-binding protein [Beijerinckiaceae bacterium]